MSGLATGSVWPITAGATLPKVTDDLIALVGGMQESCRTVAVVRHQPSRRLPLARPPWVGPRSSRDAQRHPCSSTREPRRSPRHAGGAASRDAIVSSGTPPGPAAPTPPPAVGLPNGAAPPPPPAVPGRSRLGRPPLSTGLDCAHRGTGTLHRRHRGLHHHRSEARCGCGCCRRWEHWLTLPGRWRPRRGSPRGWCQNAMQMWPQQEQPLRRDQSLLEAPRSTKREPRPQWC